ncbi:GIY-YIG nuclease family protein [Bacillus sp. Marseille-P3661]|uniref:GIY-YIG nuclease family protein n=1 Tax=Bacillus sp. Marseille-P3661 TaxID=1936234 RepID=UPI000C84B377|nr:GIY-YIG nuclease family protein [Bacillus sp. Marseille-P3661]
MENNKHYIYILECNDGTYYTGYTNNLEKRLDKHQSGKGAKYTRGRIPVKLIYSRSFNSKTAAMQEEYRIKQLTRHQKEQYVNLNNDKEENVL